MSLDDFEDLLADQPEDERWELICGRVVRMMVGARWKHNLIVGNIASGLNTRLRGAGSSCRALSGTFRLKEASTPSFLMPDVLVFCTRPVVGATYFEDASVIFEVLPPGTQSRDRQDRWLAYQRLPSLRHDVLISRDAPHAEHIDREDGCWSGFRVIEGIAAELGLAGLPPRLTDGRSLCRRTR